MITGSNSGIGFETALALARRGAELILASADARQPRPTMRPHASWSRSRTRSFTRRLDLAAQVLSVHAFANRVIERFPGQSLDLLINNAGVTALPKREVTGDGFERQFVTNYLGPFALTGLLLPSIKQMAGSRVVMVASSASKMGKIEFDNLQGERVYKPVIQAYAQSKLADLIFSQELQRRLKSRRVAHSQHRRTSWIRANKPAGRSYGAGMEDTDGNDEAFPFARRGAWGSANVVCGGLLRRQLLATVRPGMALRNWKGYLDCRTCSERAMDGSVGRAAVGRI